MKACLRTIVAFAVGMSCVSAVAQDGSANAVSATCNAVGVSVDPCVPTAPMPPGPNCIISNGMFYASVQFEAIDTGHPVLTSARIRTDLGSTGTDSNYIVFAVALPPPFDVDNGRVIGCSEDEPGPCSPSSMLGDICLTNLIVGGVYEVVVGTKDDFCPSGGAPYVVTVECPCPPPCGDGCCDAAAGEDCSNCLVDCPCPPCTTCNTLTGICDTVCSDGICDPACNEDCNTCPADCPPCEKTFGVGCQPSDPFDPDNPCPGGTSYSLRFTWLNSGTSFVNLNCPALTSPTTGTIATTALVACINTLPGSPNIVAVQHANPSLHPHFTVTAKDKKDFELCVGPAGGPPNECCFNTVIGCTFNPEVIEIIPSQTDCNGNREDDALDIFFGTLHDADGNGIPDECEAIPTVSAWGLLAFTLSLVAGAKVYFGRRQRVKMSL